MSHICLRVAWSERSKNFRFEDEWEIYDTFRPIFITLKKMEGRWRADALTQFTFCKEHVVVHMYAE